MHLSFIKGNFRLIWLTVYHKQILDIHNKSDYFSDMEDRGLYTIRLVSERTGLSPHVIRAWEKRYQAVVPQRSSTNRRLYFDHDVQRLQILKQMTDAGYTISRVAKLNSDELRELAQKEASNFPRASMSRGRSKRQPAADKYYNDGLTAVVNLDPNGLESTLDQAAIELTRLTLLRDVVIPLFEEIGYLWRNGNLKIINEHMATSVTRTFLLNLLRATEISDSAPKIVIATTVGQWHDMGALTVALTAAEYGWHPLYFGPNLPAEEIAAAVKLSSASAVAISITHLLDQHPLSGELRKLRRYVGNGVALFIGGQSAVDNAHIADEVNAKYIANFEQLIEELNSVLTDNVA